METKSFVLICDDNRAIANSLVYMLEHAGYRAQAVNAALNCVAIARKDTPALIIMDIMMPGMDGVEACRRIRSNPVTAHIPVLMFSALSGDDDVERARLAGANHLITKPFNLVGLGSVVKSFFSQDTTAAV